MSVIVFCGPTIGQREASKILDATYLPPASFGSVYRAAREKPTAIGIIDGVFESEPAIWHKEILWALSQGIHVFGASSMGALRAAECRVFGMVGVGKIAALFSSGDLEGDDEVAIAHGTADDGHRPLSIALVDIRFTLRRAEREQIIDRETKISLVNIGKALHFRERNYSALFRKARASAVSAEQLSALEGWLPRGLTHQKRDDAVSLLSHLRAWLDARPPPKEVSFSFSHTDAWEAAKKTMDATSTVLSRPSSPHDAVEELKLSSQYPNVRQEAMARALGVYTCAHLGREPDLETMGRAMDGLRVHLDIKNDDDFAAWMRQEELPEDELAAFAREEALSCWSALLFSSDADLRLHAVLRRRGIFGALAERARQKARLLATDDASPPPVVSEQARALLGWYFGDVLGRDIPLNLASYAKLHGFGTEEELVRSLLRERKARELGLPEFSK